MEKKMKALTICQPWAWAIVHGAKRIENRTWRTGFRGRLAIHAGMSRRWLLGEVVLPDGTPVPPATSLMFGAIVGTATLVDCVQDIAAPAALRDNAFAEGPWYWVLDEVVACDPIPCRGALGLWDFRPLRPCRICGCTDLNCSGCVERTGEPCYWVEPDLCSACAADAAAGVSDREGTV